MLSPRRKACIPFARGLCPKLRKEIQTEPPKIQLLRKSEIEDQHAAGQPRAVSSVQHTGKQSLQPCWLPQLKFVVTSSIP